MNIQTIPAPPSVSSANSRPVFSRWVPAPLIAAEQDLAERFLGDDLDAICAAAVAAGDPVFIATAALPLAKRKDAVKNWRAKAAARIVSTVPEAQAFHASASQECWERVISGETHLAELERMIAESREKIRAARNVALMASKERLAASLRGAMRDCDDSESGSIWPGSIVILETGEAVLFRRRGAAVQFGRDAGCRFMLAEIAGDKVSIHPGPEAG